MVRSVFLLFSVFTFSTAALGVEKTFDFNANCLKAYQQIMALQQQAAKQTLYREQAQNPDNLIPVYLADYIDCLELLFNGNPKTYEELKGQHSKRLDLLEAGQHDNPWYTFCRANIYLHWAMIQLRFDDKLRAATKFRKSFMLLKEGKERFPNFEAYSVFFGLEQAIAGAIPEQYKWIGSILGIKGNINQGVGSITSFLNKHADQQTPLYEEAMIYYVYLKFYLQNEPQVAWHFLNSQQYQEQGNLMRSFIKANIALNYRKADIALDILTKASAINTYQQYPMLEYERAEAMLLHLDLNCISAYQNFLNHYKGDYFIKDAWLKIAWANYLQGKTTEGLLKALLQNGKSITDADKQAQRFALQPTWPLTQLLKVQLLIDGGYYQSALEHIEKIDKKDLTELSYKLAYNFRYGRIFEELGNNANAIVFYNASIALGRNEKEYYAARASLQKAFIYERQGKQKEAILQYHDCLSMRHHDLQSSIDQQAKAGLNRLEH